MLTFKQYITEKWIRPTGSQEHDEVKFQSDAGAEGLDDIKNKQKYRNALRTGKTRVIPAYKMKGLQNTDAGGRSIKSFTKLHPKKKARVSRIVGGRRDIEMPIVRNKWIISGNTRATAKALRGEPITVLDIGKSK